MTRKYLLPAGWLGAIYLATALAEGARPPELFWARLLFELQHVAAHSLAYAVQAGLIAAAIPVAGGHRASLGLLMLIAVLGAGQETLQSLLRARVEAFGSLFDLAVDVAAAALALHWWRRWHAGHGLPAPVSHLDPGS